MMLKDHQEEYERLLMMSDVDTLELSRHLQRAAFSVQGNDDLVGAFVPAPVYLFQAAALMTDNIARQFVLNLLKTREPKE